MGCVPKTCCRFYCQAHPPTDEETDKQKKLCSRCRTAVAVVAPVITVLFFEFYSTKPNSTSAHTRRQNVLVHRNVWAVCFKTCCRWYCQAHPPIDEGKQEKLCCKCRTAVVVVASATKSSVGHLSGCRTFAFKLCRTWSWGTRKHTTKSSTCTKGSKVRSKAERTATLTLASCVLLLLLLLLLLFCCRRSSAEDVIHQ